MPFILTDPEETLYEPIAENVEEPTVEETVQAVEDDGVVDESLVDATALLSEAIEDTNLAPSSESGIVEPEGLPSF